MKKTLFISILLCALLLVPAMAAVQKVSKHDADLVRQYFGKEMKYRLNFQQVQTFYKFQLQWDNRHLIRIFGKNAWNYVPMNTVYDLDGNDPLVWYIGVTSRNWKRFVSIPKNIREDRDRFVQNVKKFYEEAETLPAFYATIKKGFDGDIKAYANYLYYYSAFSSLHNFAVFHTARSSRQILEDPLVLFTISLRLYLAQAGGN